MKVKLGKATLGIAAVLCIVEAMIAPSDGEPGPIPTLVLALLLLRRVFIASSQSIMAIIAGFGLALVAVCGDRNLLDINKPFFLMVILVGGVFFVFGERIEKLLWRSGS